MTLRHWFSALALGSAILPTWAQACGLRDNGATMTDPVSGIEIQKCAIGDRWSSQGCSGSVKKFTWDEAVRDYGQGEWRLMTRDEAQQLVVRSKGCPVGYSWTSTPVAGDSNSAWQTSLQEGGVFRENRKSISFGAFVRLVRSGQPGGSSATSTNNPQSSAASSQLPPYRGPAPQSGEECMAMVKGGAREKGFKDPVDQIGQHLACLAEWRKIQQARQGSQPAQNSAQTPEQQTAQRAAAQAREAQAKGDADAQRQGRRRHDPAMEAHECINLNSGPNPINSCNYKVNVIACVTEPRQTQNMMNNNEMFVCGGKSGGLWNPRPGGAIYGIYPRTAGMVHWFACKDPAEPMEVTFDGTQLVGRCRVLFAN